MKATGFYKHRASLDSEYTEPVWNTASGMEPAELQRHVDRILTDNAGLPKPILRAQIFAFILEHAKIGINPDNLFADKANCGRIMKDLGRKWIVDTLTAELPDDLRKVHAGRAAGVFSLWPDFIHASPNWEDLFALGFQGLLDRAADAKAARQACGSLTDQEAHFYDGVILTYRAVVGYVGRLRAEAARMGMTGLAACLAHIEKHPPATLHHVLETTCLYHFLQEMGIERARSLGLVDRLYAPFYRSDLAGGRIDPAQAREMFRHFFNLFSARQIGNDQPMALGGVYADGSPAENELTDLMLDVYAELDIHSPKIQLRVHPGMSAGLVKKVLGLIRGGNSSIVLINDEAVYRAYARIGIPLGEARGYLPIGCYEPTLPGREEAMIAACWLNIAKAVELALTGGTDMLTGAPLGAATPADFRDFADFHQAFLTQFGGIIDTVLDFLVKCAPHHAEMDPASLYSGTFGSCIEKGRDIFDGGAVYNNTSIKCCCIASAVDSLLAVRQVVFDDRTLTLREFADVLRDNWKGHDTLRRAIGIRAPKFGNQDAEADELAAGIYRFAADRIVGRDNGRGGVFRLGADSVGHYRIFGERMAATPDGRGAQAVLSKNFCAVTGRDRQGVTAHILSALAIDHTAFLDGAVFDFLLHPTAVEGPDGLAAMHGLVKAYFAGGGMAIQGNIFDAATLRDAQLHPEAYAGLQVRICGWNARFVDLNKLEQDEFIKRAEAM